MSTGLRFRKIGCALCLSVAVLCAGTVVPAGASSEHPKKKVKAKKAELPPLPSGPTGRPVQPMPLDSIAAVPPQVTYQENQLTIVAPNSTLGDILRAVKKQTGAEIEIPSAPERVVTHLGPGPARSVVAELLNGSRFNYVLLGSPQDDTALTRVVLVAKSGPENISPNPPATAPQPQITQATPQPPQAQDGAPPDGNDTEAAEDNNPPADDNGDQAAAEAEQQANPPDQPGVKTPQQMLQEMQQRQIQLQQQQPQGQAPVPGSGMPPHPPQEQ